MNKQALVDSNILIYAHDSDSPFFDAASSFIAESIKAKSICFSPQIFLESYRIWTQKSAKPICPKDAWRIVDYYKANSVPILSSPIKAYDYLQDSTIRYNVTGVHIFDAYIVATMIEHSVSTLYTTNIKDFVKYREIQAVNPL